MSRIAIGAALALVLAATAPTQKMQRARKSASPMWVGRTFR